MKLRNIFLILVLLPLLLASQENKDDFKIITYNIWNGYDWGKDEPRRVKLQHWMNAQSLDVVALQEVNRGVRRTAVTRSRAGGIDQDEVCIRREPRISAWRLWQCGAVPILDSGTG